MNDTPNKKNSFLTIGVLLAIVLSGFAIASSGSDVKPIEVVKPGEPQVGAVTGPDLYSPYFNVNGSYMFVDRKAMRSATTTVCSMLSPNSTTTLVSATVDIKSGTTTAMLLEMGRASTRFATTTLMARLAMASSAVPTIVATTTSLTDLIIAPNSLVNVNIAGAYGGDYTNFAPIGVCTLVTRGI